MRLLEPEPATRAEQKPVTNNRQRVARSGLLRFTEMMSANVDPRPKVVLVVCAIEEVIGLAICCESAVMDDALAAIDALMLVTEFRSSLRRLVTSSSTYRPHGSDAGGRFLLGGLLVAIVPPQRNQREITDELVEVLLVEIGNRSAVPNFIEVTNYCIKFSRVRHIRWIERGLCNTEVRIVGPHTSPCRITERLHGELVPNGGFPRLRELENRHTEIPVVEVLDGLGTQPRTVEVPHRGVDTCIRATAVDVPRGAVDLVRQSAVPGCRPRTERVRLCLRVDVRVLHHHTDIGARNVLGRTRGDANRLLVQPRADAVNVQRVVVVARSRRHGDTERSQARDVRASQLHRDSG